MPHFKSPPDTLNFTQNSDNPQPRLPNKEGAISETQRLPVIYGIPYCWFALWGSFLVIALGGGRAYPIVGSPWGLVKSLCLAAVALSNALRFYSPLSNALMFYCLKTNRSEKSGGSENPKMPKIRKCKKYKKLQKNAKNAKNTKIAKKCIKEIII